MRIAVIIKGKSPRKDDFYRDLSENANFTRIQDLQILETEYAGHAVKLAASCCAGVDYLIAGGGDGTLNEVVNGCMQALDNAPGLSLPAVGVLALGTANDFLKTTNADGSVAQLLELIREGKRTRIDVGRIHYRQQDGKNGQRYFVNVADIGIGASVVQRMGGSRPWLGANGHYLLAIVTGFLTYRKQLLKLSSSSGFSWQGKCLAALVGNGKCFGSGLYALPAARLDSGELELTVVGDVALLDFIQKLPLLRKGSSINHPQVFYSRASEFQAQHVSTPIGVEVDGEYLGTTPVKIGILPAALEILLP